jgi:hypothetical protein
VSHRKKEICEHCGTMIEWYAWPRYIWAHTELPLEHTAGHSATPEIDRGNKLGGLNYMAARR